MGLFELVVILAVIGVCLYLFNRYVTAIDGKVKQVINWVVIAVVILIVLNAFGILAMFHDVQVPRVTR